MSISLTHYSFFFCPYSQEAPGSDAETYEVAVMQRTLLADDPVSCTYCGANASVNENGEKKAIKRCLKCLKAGYCDQ